MKFNELSNEELVFIYVLLSDMLKTYNDSLEQGGIKYIMDSPLGKVALFREFTEEDVKEITTGGKYRILKTIEDKLMPIIELITDANPSMIDEIEEILRINNSSEDESQEEDL